jgi:hypothetical protein
MSQLELPNFLRESSTNIAWCTIFLQTVSKAAPACAMPEDAADREIHHWWKAKKWAYFNLNRLYIRYVEPSMFWGEYVATAGRLT